MPLNWKLGKVDRLFQNDAGLVAMPMAGLLKVMTLFEEEPEEPDPKLMTGIEGEGRVSEVPEEEEELLVPAEKLNSNGVNQAIIFKLLILAQSI